MENSILQQIILSNILYLRLNILFILKLYIYASECLIFKRKNELILLQTKSS